MPTEVLGTVENGVLTLDAALPFRERTRVRLTVEPVEPGEPLNEAQAAWERIKQRLRERPIHSGGVKYTRDQLHERG